MHLLLRSLGIDWEAEHGYASLCPSHNLGPVNRGRRRPKAPRDSLRSVHSELEKHRRAQLRRCLEQLKQQMPLSTDCARYTTLSLLRRARLHIQKLEEQEQRARRLKDRLRSEQRSLRQRLEQLRGSAGERERLRVDSLDSSGLSSERSDTDQEELEVDVESLVFGGGAELLRGFSTGQEHSYSHSGTAWL
ncbi:max dimerization protein 3 isoform X2 [Sminthopsis crassicaudata]|uniref:max dimerization protein 3 isoform X2 n=1 Tax=Sminthopsis crassicaudata TaxID=9301 RepID=UPI003D6883C7